VPISSSGLKLGKMKSVKQNSEITGLPRKLRIGRYLKELSKE